MLSIDVIADGAATADAYALLEVRAPAGLSLPPHLPSREDGVLIVLEGEVDVVCGDERRTLADGDQLPLPCRAPRRMRVTRDARLLLLVMPAGLERLAHLGSPPWPHADDLAAVLAGAGVSLLPPGWGYAEADTRSRPARLAS